MASSHYGNTSSPAASMFKSPPTALQLLLEEINFQRTKEMRQLLKDGKLDLNFHKSMMAGDYRFFPLVVAMS